MLFVEICVGSSCHLKGAPDIAEMFREKIEKGKLEDDIILTGCFCAGRCNREGVTVKVGETVYTGVTKEGFPAFWDTRVLPAVEADRAGTL